MSNILFVSFFVYLLADQSSNVHSSTDQRRSAPPQVPKGPANDWSIEEVIQFITATDPALAVHADLFREHVSYR